ncbi:NTP transferase domain-containing protein [Candidatus Gracilibacteria bacterium]|nr:NTP transferase domain-containing protein [Candidatus Gracilibacteria bacterium]
MEGIIIAGGYGTRMLPISKIIAKEMMPIGDKPVIQYIVDGLVGIGIKDIIILTTGQKRIIKDRFTNNKEIENILEETGKIEYLEKIRRPIEIANYKFIKQTNRLGTGGALLQLKNHIKEDFFFINFGDAIYDKNDFQKIFNKFQETKSPVIGIIPQPIEETSNHGVAKINGDKLIEIEESRDIKKAPSNYIRDGFCILPYEIFEILKNIKKERNGKKFRLADGINILLKKTDIYTVKIDSYRDIGNIKKRLKANNKIYKDGSLF